ncbi:Crp/Fnr family transcriptional regulator [Winogradskyella bathintestinalis]|uniref:Crp/Fnr family transcriptional regulator n=1 Tax=Winogradskyella bathintestinalis TaxID=3035208 RepID=A0ABT7ZT40_9FLAO|nr:Crp/Fnr family transcriptional regulator [Winogradskyella bathintestinalis]MDN3492170.1 Crp/Fnr family transcriptional regulator [Winogradskyella bathintestinalis]
MTEALRTEYGSQFEPALIEEINQVATLVELPEGQDLIRPGQYIKAMPLLLSGSIKIMRPDGDGEELLLYHLEKGDTCAMTMSCCIGNTISEIHAVTETEVKLLMIPVELMEVWSRKYKTWRDFVFSSYHARMMELLESVDNIAFHNMGERLEKYLHDKKEILNSRFIYITHKEIANDLHTSRVVVSRLLKKMEYDDKISLHRSFIEIM